MERIKMPGDALNDKAFIVSGDPDDLSRGFAEFEKAANDPDPMISVQGIIGMSVMTCVQKIMKADEPGVAIAATAHALVGGINNMLGLLPPALRPSLEKLMAEQKNVYDRARAGIEATPASTNH